MARPAFIPVMIATLRPRNSGPPTMATGCGGATTPGGGGGWFFIMKPNSPPKNAPARVRRIHHQ
jgi:hypothetical protein